MSEAQHDNDGSSGGAPGSPGVSFSEFVLSLAANAMAFMGEETPNEVPSRADLQQAAQHIDLVAMLKRKTAGNLDSEEQHLIDALLYELRMKYLDASQKAR